MLRIWELMSLAVQGVFRARLRSGLTILGVSIASGSLVCMIAFVLGFQQQLEAPARQLGMFNNIEVFAKSADDDDDDDHVQAVLDDAAVEQFEAIEGVEFAYPDLRLSQVRITHNEDSATSYAIGLPREATLIGLFGDLIVEGQFFSLATRPEAVIGEQLAKDLGFAIPADAIGAPLSLESSGLEQASDDEFRLERREQSVTVTGIFRPPSFATSFGSKVVLLPLDVIRKLPGSELERTLRRLRTARTGSWHGYSQVIVRARRFSNVPTIEQAIQAQGFTTRTLSSQMQEAKVFFVFMEVLLAAVGTVALIVAGLGILNTLLMSVLQRIREIGIYKAVGASDGDLRLLFLTEAGLLGFFGGIGGLMLARIVAWAIQWGVQEYAIRQGVEGPVDVFEFPWWLLMSSVAYAVFVSVVSGLYPANRAAQVDPIQALRYE